jgi:hypothetical protein
MSRSVVERLALDAGIGMGARADEKGGLRKLGEKADLEPVVVDVLRAALPDWHVEKTRKTRIPRWSRAGTVDVRVRQDLGSSALLLAGELKWCGAGQMYEAIWDLFKMALLALREDAGTTFLLTGAPSSKWQADPCRDLFEDRLHEPLELFDRRFPTGKGRLMWDDLLEGGYDRYPDAVPARIRTAVIADEPIDHPAGDWAIRAVEVTPLEGFIPIRAGWPNGERPADATRPLAKP